MFRGEYGARAAASEFTADGRRGHRHPAGRYVTP